MKAKLKVLVPFTDKNDRTVRYKEGDTVFFDDIERVNDLVARKVCRLEAFEAEKPEAAAANEIAVVKVALEAIGVTVSKNAGVPAVGKAVAGLTDDERAKLAETLTASEE
jgi:hypothetical protein